MDWRDYIEKHTGEVSTVTVAECLGMSHDDVMAFCAANHGSRFVGGTSRHLMWAEDAADLEVEQARTLKRCAD